MTARESSIVQTITRRLLSVDSRVFVTKLHAGPTQRVGLPDLLIITPTSVCPTCGSGLHFFAEVKVPGKSAEPVQRHCMHTIRRAGGRADVVHNWPELAEQLGLGSAGDNHAD